VTAFVIVDVETSGLDPEQDELLEVGAVAFDADHGVPVSVWSDLCRAESNAAEQVNHIPEAALSRGAGRAATLARLREFVDESRDRNGGVDPYVLAHKAEFDRQWLPLLDEKRWVCTKEDADWPLSDREGPSLVHLALAYEVGVVRAHRAIEDCLTLAAVLSRVHAVERGLDDPGVTLDGVPFEQASSAEQLRCSVAMGLALNPKLRVLLIRDGSLLDEDSLRMVAEMADAQGAQVWLERVGDGVAGVLIEDGEVRS